MTKPFSERFLKQAQRRRRKIGIAILRPMPETIESLRRASAVADITVVGAEVGGFQNVVEDDPDEAARVLVRLLKENAIDGLVRGQVKDSFTLDEFHRQSGRSPLPSNRKVCPVILEKDDTSLVMTTGSIYQGLTLEDKLFEVRRIIRYLTETLGIQPSIAVLSSLRSTSKHGLSPALDTVAALNAALATALRAEGHEVAEYGLEYETAVRSGANLIVPSTGLVGNAWMKALLYLGGWQLIASPYLDLGVVYEDGSRNETNFYWHVVYAVAMANSSQPVG